MDMIRVRAVSPPDLTERAVEVLSGDPCVLNLVVAGIVGIVSLTESRTSALLGVFISVTTIPAAADIGVSTAFSSWHEARGSLVQLLVNIVVLIVVGTLTLTCQRAIWKRVDRRSGRHNPGLTVAGH